MSTQNTAATHQFIHIHGRTCPRCYGSVMRVRRRYIDRLISVVVPVHRYHCISPSCGWTGNLRVRLK